jgi:hypothetical protein
LSAGSRWHLPSTSAIAATSRSGSPHSTVSQSRRAGSASSQPSPTKFP